MPVGQTGPLPRSRMLARILILATLGVVSLLLYTVGRPVYWRLYATAIRPFNSGSSKDSSGVLLGDEAVVTDEKKSSQLSKARATRFNPKDKRFLLTKGRAHRIAQDGYLLVTWSNYHYIDFVRSWLYNVERAGISGYIVGALDDDMLKELDKVKVNTWRLNSGLSKGDFGWGSPQFRRMGRSKINLIRSTLTLGLHIIISDVDVQWIRNPIPFFQKYPEVDLLTSSDHIKNSTAGEELEGFETVHSTANIGIMMFRPSALPLADAWVKKVEQQDIWDQQAFNDPSMFRAGMKPVDGDNRGVFWAFNGTLKMGIMPVSLFAGGHTFFVQRLAKSLGMVPYAAHPTFQYSGTWGKRHRLREAGLFYDLPSYFTHPVGFITFNLDLPLSLLKNAGPNPTNPFTPESVKGHFKLVHHQYKRLRSAFALATITGRALIVPPVWCGVDKFWGPLEGGRIGGSSPFELPFQCPLDHILRLEFGIFGPPLNNTHEYGPVIEIREHSFLLHPNTPRTLLESILPVEVCAPASGPNCGDGTAPAKIQDGKLCLKAGLPSSHVLKALASASKHKVWNFTTMEGVLEGPLEDSDMWSKFQKRLKMYPETFCCVNQHPGHFWYDFWFDQPHTDRFNRHFAGTPDEWIKNRGDTTQP